MKNCVWWLAWRNLRNPHRGLGLSVMTNVSIAGVAMGVLALVVVLSIMGGLARSLKESMYRGMPHVEVRMRENPMHGFSLLEYPLSFFKQKFPQAQAIVPYVQADVVLKNDRHLSTATLFAIDPAVSKKIWGFQKPISMQGRAITATAQGQLPAIMVGSDLSYQLGVDVGDELVILNASAIAHAGSNVSASARTFRVVGIFTTGLFNYDEKWAVVPFKEGRKFLPDYDPSLEAEKYVSGVALNFHNPDKVEEQTDTLQGSPLQAVSWKESNASVMFALKLERFAMGAILLLIILVASFSISSTMMMTVFYRRSQIALLRAIGLCRVKTFQVFLLQGLLIGVLGATIGMLLGLLVLLVIDKMPIPLPTDIYVLKSLSVRFLWRDYLVIGILALFLSSLSATYPASVAALASPSKGLGIK